jgi:alkylation response protein AidB-like acyl-CoA dehydrogenase
VTERLDAEHNETIDEYRARARCWLEANLEKRPRGGALFGPGLLRAEKSMQEIAAQRALQKKLYQAGYAGITWPKEYGGQGLSAAYEWAFREEARPFLLPDLGTVGGATMGVCAPTMLAHGSPDFLAHHIPRILAGDEIVAQFFSDPDAGSDLAGVRTQAVRDGERWILSGSKIWSSGAYYADVGMCLARTNWDVPKHRGLTWFLVPTDAPGVTIERIRQINGNSEFCQEFFSDVVLSDDDIIGGVNEGWTVTQTMLLYERGAGAMQTQGARRERTGVARDIVELVKALGGQANLEVLDHAARIHVDDLARVALGRRLAAKIAEDPVVAVNIASYAKLASGTLDPVRANLAMRIAGAAGIAWASAETPGAVAATGLLNSRFLSIAGGTNEVQRNSIGERVLGLPREPSFDSTKPFREVVQNARNWSGAVG